MSEVQKEKEIKPYSCSPRAPRRCPTPLGEQFMIRAQLSIDKDGNQIAEPGEKVDLQAMIQASRKSTDMATIISRYNAGDESVLNVTPNGFYGDVTIIPSSVNDYEKINKLGEIASDKFAALPQEVQDAFGGDSNAFLNAVISNKVDSIISDYAKSKEQAFKEAEEK